MNREHYAEIVATAEASGWSIADGDGLTGDNATFHADGRLVRFVRDGTYVRVYWNCGGYLCVGRERENVLAALTGDGRIRLDDGTVIP